MRMRNLCKLVLGLLVGLSVLAGNVGAQFKNGSQPTELNIPRVSQRGTVTQRIGLTDITITYHRPAVDGREIWAKRSLTGRYGAPARMRIPPSLSPTMSPWKENPLRQARMVCTPSLTKISGQ